MTEQSYSNRNPHPAFLQKTKNIDPPIGKSVSPLAQPRLSHNTMYTNSTKDLNAKREEPRQFKPNSNGSSFVPNRGPQYDSTSPKNVLPNGKPSFLQGKGESKNPMKGSMFMSQSQNQTNTKSSKTYESGFHQFGAGSMGEGHHKRMPRMSQQPQMKFSSIQFGNNLEGHSPKVPSFLQEKHKDVGQRKVPYQNQLQRPQSSKQTIMSKSSMPMDSTLSSSYGGMKRSKIDTSSNGYDPTSEWIKKSWSKKKQKKYSIDDFEQIKQLGTGKYGHVFLAREKKSNFICAIKIIEKKLLIEEQITEQFIRELKIQSYLNHPNIIRMYGFFDDAVNIYLLMEVAMGGQLFKQLKKLQSMPEAKVAGIIRQVCQSVNQLHSSQIIHRDIKPQNIVLHENVIKLCDFGWSVYRDQNMRTTFCGTPLYVGPQILRGKQYDEKIDIWSLGVMMYQMLVGENPFKITKEQQLVKIIKDEIKIPSYVELSEEAHSFLFSCLQKNPDHRLNIRELMAHSFFKKYPDKNDKKMGF